MAKITEKALRARDAKRDIGAELLQSMRDLKAGRWGARLLSKCCPTARCVGAPSCPAAKW